MKLYEIYFSPTGGTRKVSGILSSEWDCGKTEIDLSDTQADFPEYQFGEDDICIVSVPVFGGRVPVPAIENLGKLRGNGAKAVLVAVYGNRAYEDALLEVKDAAVSAGFVCVAGIAAIAEHSIMHQFAAGRPDETDRGQLLTFAKEIRKKLEAGEVPGGLCVPGNHPYKELKVVPMVPVAGEECISCGICAKKCPVGAISKENPMETDGDTCIACMRCISVCPEQARRIDSAAVEALSNRLFDICTVRKENELYLAICITCS